MSWRIRIEPWGRNKGEDTWEDWSIPEGATEEMIDAIAKEAAWHLPLRIFTLSPFDPRVLRLRYVLEEEFSMQPHHYSVEGYD